MALAKGSDLTSGELRGLAAGLVPVRLTGALTNYNGGTGGSAVVPENPDGSGEAAGLTCNAGTQAASIYRDRVAGRVIGVRVRRDQNTPPFDIVVDGEVFPIDNPRLLINNRSSPGSDLFSPIVVPRVFDDGYHNVEIHLVSHPDGVTARTIRLFGWSAEASAGYNQENQRLSLLYPSNTTLGTSTSSVPFTGTVGRLCFQNTDTAAHDVTLTRLDGTTPWVTIRIPAGEDAQFPDGGFRPPLKPTGVNWRCDTAGVVRAWAEGA
ncbi:hypothetical protein KNU62_gp37 [Gordonia phage Bakery]|uniref:Uncharacterized protein n=1 Tax=Gordonia phage Bakery TaxID=2591205 RepID=A0A514DGT9_9CAUD|nr:hypothetical protein KNU62_gp37 [Gordonia phage Bakery]QDH92822.1 hypothetical protein SEA_BAKERY_37 [Gordonia phage Bakery]